MEGLFPWPCLPKVGYGVPEGLVFSFPCRCQNGQIEVVQDLPIDSFAQSKIDENVAMLMEERQAVTGLLN